MNQVVAVVLGGLILLGGGGMSAFLVGKFGKSGVAARFIGDPIKKIVGEAVQQTVNGSVAKVQESVDQFRSDFAAHVKRSEDQFEAGAAKMAQHEQRIATVEADRTDTAVKVATVATRIDTMMEMQKGRR